MRLTEDQIRRIARQNFRSGTSGTTIYGGGGGGVSEDWVDENYIGKDFFNELFIIHTTITITVTDEHGDPVGEPTVTEGVLDPNVSPSTTSVVDEETGYTTTTVVTISSIEAKVGLWTDFFLSALGLNDSGGGGGASTLANLLDVQLTNPSNGQALIYNSTLSKWVNGTVQVGSVTSVGLAVPSGSHLLVNNSASATITTSGTFALTIQTGYSIPLTSKQSNWDAAYNWVSVPRSTISDYGITDAYISGGTIHLAGDSLSPVTSITAGTGLSGGTITSSGTIAINSTYQTYISHGQTAYGWGNHANAGYLTASSLNGYATQSWVQSQGYLTDAMKNFVSESSDLNSLTDSGSYRLGTGNTNKPSDDNYAQLLVVMGGGDTAAQIFFPYGRSTAYLRNGNPLNATGSWRGWKEMAFTDSNVSSATKLQNARLLWGNSFDGTANIGDSTTRKGLNYVSNIMMTGSIGSDAGDHLQNIYMAYFIYGPRGIEMNKYGGESGNGGFIDFHFAGSSADYTARIIEDSTNVVSIYAKNSSGTMVAPTLQVGPGNYAAGVRIGNGMIVWDANNNALKVQKADGTAANLYALGGVSSLGFSAGSTSTSITNLTVTNRLTIQDGGTIASDGELYIGSTSNDATIFVNDIGSMMDYDLWHIGAETGYATFARTYCPRFYFDNTRYLQYSGGHLQFYNGTSFINLT